MEGRAKRGWGGRRADEKMGFFISFGERWRTGPLLDGKRETLQRSSEASSKDASASLASRLHSRKESRCPN